MYNFQTVCEHSVSRHLLIAKFKEHHYFFKPVFMWAIKN